MVFKVVRTIEGAHLDKEKYREIGAEFVVIPCETEDEIIAATHDSDAVHTYLQPFTKKVMRRLNKCKLIHNIGTGYDGVDIEAATECGICVSYPGDYCMGEVAEHTMALILACARKIVHLDKSVREGKWDSHGKWGIRKLWAPMFQIKGQTLGLIGFGRIAREIVPKAKGFGLRIVAFDPYVPHSIFKELGVESVTLDHLLKESDYVSVHAALTQENRHLLGLEQFRKMKSTAYFINTSRASIASEQALCTALGRGYIAGAALDVVEGEHVGLDHPLLQFENIILTGHSAFYSEHSISELKQRAYEETARVIRGEWPLRLLNPEVKEDFVKRWVRAGTSTGLA
jgi:D-3-phosphoglycerate dehydrogenase